MTLREQVRYDVLARPSCGAEEEEMHDLDDLITGSWVGRMEERLRCKRGRG
jgi:hypothetical protein